MTPISQGVFLNKREIDAALELNPRIAYETLESIAQTLGIDFQWCDPHWPDAHGAYLKANGKPEIWIPHSTAFHEACTFGHELHHFIFAPDVECWKEMNALQIARWEGKATAFGALVAMPNVHFKDADLVRRAYGPGFEHYAHYRILHLQKHGW